MNLYCLLRLSLIPKISNCQKKLTPSRCIPNYNTNSSVCPALFFTLRFQLNSVNAGPKIPKKQEEMETLTVEMVQWTANYDKYAHSHAILYSNHMLNLTNFHRKHGELRMALRNIALAKYNGIKQETVLAASALAVKMIDHCVTEQLSEKFFPEKDIM